MSKAIIPLISLIVGLLGLTGCLVVMTYIWRVNTRMYQATEWVFTSTDEVIVNVQQRVVAIEERILNLKVTSKSVAENLKARAIAKAGEIISRHDSEEQAEAIFFDIERAEHWLELTKLSVQMIQKISNSRNSLGIFVESDLVEELLSEIESVRIKLRQSSASAFNIFQRLSELGEEELNTENSHKIARWLGEVTETLGLVDSHITKIGNQLVALQSQMRIQKARVHSWVRIGSIGIAVIVTWMAIGQVALCHIGWRGLRH